MRISSNKTIKDWRSLLVLIDKNPNNTLLWGEAFNFFEDRITTRYIKPAENISKIKSYDGEGFSIVAILCSTIEALETFRTGKIYRKATRNNPLNQELEYYKSQEVFKSFLTNQYPFCSEFVSIQLADDFYENVRCSILHEATTRNGWRIRTDTSKLIVVKENEKILNRDIFLNYVKEYIKLYKNDYMSNEILRGNFFRKFNGICNTSY